MAADKQGEAGGGWLRRWFGVGRKDADGKQVRIEHRGRHTRASRTGGVAARVEKRAGPVGVTASTAKGVRASLRVARGARVALQNGRTQFIGRWKAGPFALNLSKTGVSGSVKNRAGTFNLLKPRYSSVKFAGIQLRGQKAVYAHLAYIVFAAVFALAYLALRLALFALWLLWLLALLAIDVIAELARQLRQRPAPKKRPQPR